MNEVPEQANTLQNKLREALGLTPHVLRSFSLVFKTTPSTSSLWLTFILLQSFIPAAIVWLSKPFIDAIGAVITEQLSFSILLPFLSFFVALFLAREILKALIHYTAVKQAELVHDHITGLIQERSTEISALDYDSPDYHNILFRVQEEGGDKPIAVIEACGGTLQSLVSLLAIVCILFPYGWWLPLALLTCLIPGLVVSISYRLNQHRFRVGSTEERRKSWYYDSLLTSRSSAKEVRFFSLGKNLQDRYQHLREGLRSGILQVERTNARFQIFSALFSLLVFGAVMGLMLYNTVAGLISIGTLALVYQAFNQAQQTTSSFLLQIGELYANALYLKEIFHFLKNETPKPRKHSPPTTELALEIQDLSFQYPNRERPTLKNLSLSVHQNEIVVILGENGSGKSTLVGLIAEIYEPTSGLISRSGELSVMFQEPVRYNESFRQNVLYGDLNQHDEIHLDNILKRSRADSLCSRLGGDKDSLIGTTFSGGTELSAGEWQRVALARTLYKKADVLLLDEPTSAMDVWTEKSWLKELRELKKDAAVIIITHRLAAADIADSLYLLKEGKLEVADKDTTIDSYSRAIA